MDELKQIKKELGEFKKCIINLSLMYLRMPKSLLQINVDDLMDEIKYLCGYVDCMIECNIPLLPEPIS